MIYSPDMMCRGNLLQFNQWKLGKLVITQVHIQGYNKLLGKYYKVGNKKDSLLRGFSLFFLFVLGSWFPGDLSSCVETKGKCIGSTIVLRVWKNFQKQATFSR